MGDVARKLGVNKSTASRLLATLRDTGFIIVDADNGSYYVGPTAYALGSRFSGAALARAVQHVIRDLSDRTSSTAQFGMLQGNRVVFLIVNQGSPRLRVVMKPGDTQYVHASAMGKAMLAALPPADAAQLIKGLLDAEGRLPAAGPRTFRDPVALRADLGRTVKRGYSMSNEESSAGMIGIGAYVGNVAGIHTTLSVAFAINQHKGDELARVASSVTTAAAAARLLLLPEGFGSATAGLASMSSDSGPHGHDVQAGMPTVSE